MLASHLSKHHGCSHTCFSHFLHFHPCYPTDVFQCQHFTWGLPLPIRTQHSLCGAGWHCCRVKISLGSPQQEWSWHNSSSLTLTQDNPDACSMSSPRMPPQELTPNGHSDSWLDIALHIAPSQLLHPLPTSGIDSQAISLHSAHCFRFGFWGSQRKIPGSIHPLYNYMLFWFSHWSCHKMFSYP